MKIGFDASTAAFRQKTGTGVYCEELILAYQRRFPSDRVTHSYRFSRRFKGRKYLLPLTENSKRETLLDPWTFLNGYKYDIFHGLNSRLPILAHCKMVATIHDLFSIFGEFSNPDFRKDQSQKLAVMINLADHIIVPASYTRDELINRLGYSKQKISVVPQGVRDIYTQSRERNISKELLLQKFNIDTQFLLFVGTLEKRKNLVGLIRSYCALKKLTDSLPDLVLVGHEGYGYQEIALEIQKSGLKDKIKILGFVNEDILAHLYTACEVLVYLSLEEGFGIPVIEAMACGAPVLTSNTTSLPEAGQGHSWLVNPYDYEEVSHILKTILEKKEDVLERVEAGKKYGRGQTWTKVAEDTRQVYELIQKS